jgi:hypothetical protein
VDFTYRQTTGQMVGVEFSAQGYSGRGPGLNNPAMQNVRNVGPLPQATYTIGLPHTHPKLGKVVMELIPDDDSQMFDRSGFFIHGDNAACNHTASDGCIELGHDPRVAIAVAVLAGHNRLEVLE